MPECQILTPDELINKLTEMFEDENLAPDHRIKIAQILGKWMGLENSDPESADKEEGFPFMGVNIELDYLRSLNSLSDEELRRLYVRTLAES